MAEKNFLLYGFWSLESKLSKKDTFFRVGAPLRGKKCGAKNFRILEQTQGGGVMSVQRGSRHFFAILENFRKIFRRKGGGANKSVVSRPAPDRV